MKTEENNAQLPQSSVSVSVTDELLQKIKFVLSCGNEAQAERLIEQFVFYQEELTIEFGNFLNNGRFTMWGNSWIDPKKNKDKDGHWIFYTTKDLYELFKRERDLTEH